MKFPNVWGSRAFLHEPSQDANQSWVRMFNNTDTLPYTVLHASDQCFNRNRQTRRLLRAILARHVRFVIAAAIVIATLHPNTPRKEVYPSPDASPTRISEDRPRPELALPKKYKESKPPLFPNRWRHVAARTPEIPLNPRTPSPAEMLYKRGFLRGPTRKAAL